MAKELRLMIYFLTKKSRDTATQRRTEIISEDQHLAIELHKAITKKFKKCKIYSSFWDNTWDADLAGMRESDSCYISLISTLNIIETCWKMKKQSLLTPYYNQQCISKHFAWEWS